MADPVELRMSLTSIKRVDPYVKNVLATATHVALYVFNTTKNEWEKTETEGALFVYSRNGEPFHSIMVMNRLNRENVIEPIVKELDYQMQIPFLLYRNSKNKIFGIWFFNREECIRITFLIESLMETLKDKNMDKSKKNDKNVDIFSMLSKAQEDFNKTPTKHEGPPKSSSTPRVPDLTSQSVMDFFARAGTKTSTKPAAPETSENVLQRLMLNPAHSVEHIEKQQQIVNPSDILVNCQKVSAVNPKDSNKATFMSTRTIRKQNPGNNENVLQRLMMNPEHSVDHIEKQQILTPLDPFGNNQLQSNSPLAFLIQNQPQAQIPVEETSNMTGVSPFAQLLENTQKPQLMTPSMFNATAGPKQTNSVENIDLLTEKQLAQALIHLLKNNSAFTKQIHEAYVQSILEKVNINDST